ncbi:bystin-like isoform X3 [Miscanthus floridulus]|uniref:bystin-like isoform X3 n=1 Tax=Miscanthus floridulus TaxID=154761 RepID=UPI003458666A
MAGKKRKSGSEKPAKHRLPLGADADAVADASKRRRSVAAKQHQEDEEASIPPSLSAKILREARKQQQEEMRADDSSDEQRPSAAEAAAGPSTSSSFPVPTVDGEEEEDDVDEFDGFDALSEYDGGEVEINEEDERALAAFMSKDKAAERTLGDIILQKIMEKDAEVATEGRPRVKLDNSIIELYKEVGKFLSRYTSGKIPKAFKRIPSLECWADVVQLTEPENWSPNAVYQATRLFSSNMNTKNAERFYEAILLPRVRNDIRKNKRLHFALYQSLKKALYKPAAFNKGILLPLCRERNCTLREAVIIGSIIQKVSIPFLHASVALVKLSEMEYCGTTRYKNELEKKDKEKLARLLDHQKHYLVTPEIRRELRGSCNRGEKDTNLQTLSPISVITKPIEEDKWDIPQVPMEED